MVKANSKEYTINHVFYYDATVEFFGHDHLLYAIVALFVGVFVIILPIVFLIIIISNEIVSEKIQHQLLPRFPQGWNEWHHTLSMVFCDWLSSSSNSYYSLTNYLFLFNRSLSRSHPHVFTPLIATIQGRIKVYNITDAFMLLIFSGVFIMAIAGDEADIKASYFSTFSYSFLALIRIVLIISVDHLVAPGKETTQNLVHKQISQL